MKGSQSFPSLWGQGVFMQNACNVRQKSSDTKENRLSRKWLNKKKIELLFLGELFLWLNEDWRKTAFYFRHSRKFKKFNRIKVCAVLLDWNGGAAHHDLVPQASQDTRGGDLPESLNWGPSSLKTLLHPSHPKSIRVIRLLLLFCMHSSGSRTRWESSKWYCLFVPHWVLLSSTELRKVLVVLLSGQSMP